MDYLTQYQNLEVNEICRICLTKKCEMLIIKDTEVENLLATLPIEILEEDRFHFVCIDCLSELNRWNDFVQQVIKSFMIGHWLIEQNCNSEEQDKKFSTDQELHSVSDESKPTSENEFLNVKEAHVVKIETEETCKTVEMLENEIDSQKEYKEASNNFTQDALGEESDIKSLKLSLTYHKNTKLKVYECGKCGKQCAQFDSINDHMMRHCNTKKFPCSICDKTFNKLYNVIEHMRIHTGERPFLCEYCPKTFTRAVILRNHIRKVRAPLRTSDHMVHSDTKQFMCEICNKPFPDNYRLKIHALIHTGGKPHQCTECGKSFAMRGQLSSHIKYRHTKVKDHVCHICLNAFTANSTLKNHLRTHRGEKAEPKHECALCGKKCVTTTQLKLHIKSKHTGERDFHCKYCDKCFVTKTALHSHTRIHTGERSFVCEICGKAFATKSTLKSHSRTHTGERPYECLQCHKKFAHANRLKSHVKRMHK